MRFPALEIVIMGKISRLFLVVFPALLAAACAPAAEPQQTKPKATILFNGKDLTGWSVYNADEGVWKVKDGVLVCTGENSRRGGAWLMSDQEFSDGMFYAEYRIVEKGNSGMAIRAPLERRPGL
jgi:hypothetical protein